MSRIKLIDIDETLSETEFDDAINKISSIFLETPAGHVVVIISDTEITPKSAADAIRDIANIIENNGIPEHPILIKSDPLN